MKHHFLLGICLFFTALCFGQNDYAKYVNPFIGTGGHGHTFPGPTVPFGMVQLSPDTRLKGWDGCSGYHYSDNVIYGFSHTHLSGTGCSDYGDILLMPTVGKPKFGNKQYASAFKKENEKASAGYYTVFMEKTKVKVELTATTRSGDCINTPFQNQHLPTLFLILPIGIELNKAKSILWAIPKLPVNELVQHGRIIKCSCM